MTTIKIQQQSSQALRVLVIDDDADDQLLISHYLDFAPTAYQLQFVSTAAEAKQALLGHFDVCLMDYHIGSRDNGVDILRSIDASALSGPVIMVTGSRDPRIDQAALKAGAADYLCKDDINQTALDRSLRYALANYKDRIRLERESRIDTLTGTLNRDRISHSLQEHIQHCPATQLALLYIDLDGFKSINDDFGHNVGDEVLSAAASRLQQALPSQCKLGRFGGDEFLALVPGVSPEAANTVAQRALEALKQPDEESGFIISASMGISHYPSQGEDPQKLIQHANQAMYFSKRNGRNTISLFSGDSKITLGHSGRLAQDLRVALQENSLSLVYQPLMSNDGRHIVGAEALARWDHPEFGPVSPEHFVNIAEASGLIRELSRWVLNQAVSDLYVWMQQKLISPCFRLGVNVSAIQFTHDELIDEVHRQIIDRPGVSSHLELELTEHAMVQDFDRTVSIIESLQRLDIKVAIDDFGTKHSCMAYLARLPVDTIKIDASFLKNIGSGGREGCVLKGLAALVHELNADLVIEGVETEEQHRAVQPLDSERLQGYLFARPMPADSLAAMMGEPKRQRATERFPRKMIA